MEDITLSMSSPELKTLYAKDRKAWRRWLEKNHAKSPQPKPGSAPAAGPMKVPAEQLGKLLGVTSVNYAEHNNTLAITDTVLSDTKENQPGQ